LGFFPFADDPNDIDEALIVFLFNCDCRVLFTEITLLDD
jgi:hypothetical protein